MVELCKDESKIHGKGIFARTKIKEGEVFYFVPLGSFSEVPKSRWAYIGKNLWISDEEVLNYVNHSCNPNSILDISDNPILIAKKEILKGEEVTVDYTLTEKGGKKVPCKCKNIKCKGYFLRME